MTVTVLLFASYAEVLGASSVELDIADGATVGDVVGAVRARGGERLPPRPLVAVNAQYAPAEQLVRAGDEIALIPPVAGG